MRYGLYTRKSHDDKKVTEKSTGEQLLECQTLADREGLTITWQCEESKSAKKPNVRPKYAELVKLIERGHIDGILCWHVNRLARNMDEGGHLVQLMIDGKLKEVRTPHATYKTGDNIWPIVLEAANATQQSLDLVQVVRRSMEGNFRAGGWNHKAPPGYLNVRDRLNSKRGSIAKDPERFPLIRKAWDLMLTGTVTVQNVRDELESWGYLVRETLNLSLRPLRYGSVIAMFRNPFYVGYVRERGELVKGKHEPMVTLDEFRRVQQILALHTSHAKRVHTHDYTGFMQCGYCGQLITAECKRLKSRIWEVYHCSDTYDRCTQRGMSWDAVKLEISSLLQGVTYDPAALAIAAEEVKQALATKQDAFRVKREQVRKSLQEAERRLQRLTEMWLSGLLTDEARYKTLEEEALLRKGNLTFQLDQASNDYDRQLKNLGRAVQYLAAGKANFEVAKPERKRAIASALGLFKFYGREKEIKLVVRPILREVASFTTSILNLLEPPKTGSDKQKVATFKESLRFGRRDTTQLEVPESLLLALSEDLLPPLDDSDSEELLGLVEGEL